MKKFENGVGWYTHAKIGTIINFPEDNICCQYCQFCRAEKELGRYWCRLTNDMIYCPESRVLPDTCPLYDFWDDKED